MEARLLDVFSHHPKNGVTLVGLEPNDVTHEAAAEEDGCRGRGTCAVKIDGEVSEPTSAERLRLSLPPHNSESGLRLACQCKVLGDLKVTKYQGLFGQRDETID